MMHVENLSSDYQVRLLQRQDVSLIYALYQSNPMYFEHMKDVPTLQSVEEDLEILPPGKQKEDKFFVGFFEGTKLIAVMDLIAGYPNQKTAFIGLFMVDKKEQGKGTGSHIVQQILEQLRREGFGAVRLGYVKSNPQSRHFWMKNGFCPTGEEKQTEHYTIVLMEKSLSDLNG